MYGGGRKVGYTRVRVHPAVTPVLEHAGWSDELGAIVHSVRQMSRQGYSSLPEAGTVSRAETSEGGWATASDFGWWKSALADTATHCHIVEEVHGKADQIIGAATIR